jgi:predicted TPR repeat methyltransferase
MMNLFRGASSHEAAATAKAMLAMREWLDITPAGANGVVNRLIAIGLLTEITGHARNRRFRFDPYLRLFEDGVGEQSNGG